MKKETITRIMLLLLITLTGSLQAQITDAASSRTRYVETGGRKIAYRSIGSGTPMILTNRFRGNLDDWDPAFLNALARKFRVVTFDYSGLSSSTGNPPNTAEGYARDVADLADALKIDKFIMCGWSIGGFGAQAATVLYPERITHTVLIGTGPPGKVTHPVEDIFLKTAFKPENTPEDEIILFFEPISQKSREAAKRSFERMASRTVDKEPEVKQELWSSYTNVAAAFQEDKNNLRAKLIATKIPLLIISGDHEICFPPENWFELNRKLETSQMVVLARTGHGPQHQYPELVANNIIEFVEQNK